MMRVLILSATLSLPLAAAQPLEIRFTAPPAANADGAKWESHGQPVGNGRIGAMVFGNPLKERIQFNDISLWTGGANPSGGYDINEFGAFQNFGDLFIEADGAAASHPAGTCVSGHVPYQESESPAAAADRNPATKWCVEPRGKDVVWQIEFPEAEVISSYDFTSGNDAPKRDPQQWRLEGSTDGKSWEPLHEMKAQAPFSKRGETKHFILPTGGKRAALRHYRLIFPPNPDVSHFQLAEINLGKPATSASLENFSRTLDLSTGIHTTTWKQDGVTFKREVFASKPDQVIVVRITADQPGKVSGKLSLKGGHGETATTIGGQNGHSAGFSIGTETKFSGSLSNGLRNAALVSVRVQDGKSEPTGNAAAFSGNSATILLAAATDYALDPAKNFRNGVNPAQTVATQVTTAAAKTYDDLRSRHVADFQKLMGRVDLDLGAPPEGKSITERLDAYKKGAADPHLEALMYQFGRYLLISCSRDILPANLQGLWNDSNKPAWNSDYHTNINIQMNYWGAESGNLAECAMPLFNWTDAMIPGSREATVKAFGEKTPGWTMRTSVNIFGGNGWEWNLPSSAWIAQHYWEHFAFTGDKKFLETTAWPLFRDVSEFWLAHLIEKDGKLVVPKGWSPEHGPREDGVAHDQQLVWDLFTNTLDAAAALGKKDDFTAKVSAAREKLLGPQVGSWDQLMEWTSERPGLEKSGHRHTSHLFAVYPGRQITLNGTPDLAKAAAISLEARGTSGDSRRSWTWPWRAALWARLGRADKAGEMVRGLLTYNTLPNLFATHPPFQIDGNLGIIGGMGEMLVQSHAGEIALLPALSPSWKDGSFKGLKARGGFVVDAQWQGGKFTKGRIQSLLGTEAVIRLPDAPAALTLKDASGKSQKLTAANGVFRFPTRPGVSYELTR